ncbi:type 1 glutamine amidotransferase [Streptomyces sp. XM4193]|uniref:type 1 glutamine amidotransferase n=1 Tax=Streptomyces sp. XM4193 TaxID=2929782 RepID=UPI001FF7FA15|nr:type 1 glutamine amidotransferase [Streptomyces sp. XM4193]MCK1794489.1 type 1 glutamine amidotransferase [Streptomyces sp. XM4193]
MTAGLSPSPRVLVVRNSEGSAPRRLLPWLAEEGVTCEEVEGPDVPTAADGYDGAVLLGGGFMPDDDLRRPWLARERALARHAVDEGVPLLGICLGAQLLAVARGGTAASSHGTPERGSCSVQLLGEAKEDELLNDLPAHFPVIQNHRDQITELPPGAVHLARSEACPVQAFRVGDRAWGVQFHPEVDAARLAQWDESALTEEGLDLDALRARAEQAEPESARAARQLVANFAAVVHTYAAGRRSPTVG